MELLVNYGIRASAAGGVKFIDATGGEIYEYDVGDIRYRTQTFERTGTYDFTVNQIATDPTKNQIDFVMIAGGGAGASGYGAGGAGGYLSSLTPTSNNVTPQSKITASVQTYPITVGAGGAANKSSNLTYSQGRNTVAFGLTALGGGYGNSANSGAGSVGGSGGAGGWQTGSVQGTAGQGFAGGSGAVSDPYYAGGGGGGAGAVGGNGNVTTGARHGGIGGAGLISSIRTNFPELKAGGGGGAVYSASGTSIRMSGPFVNGGTEYGGGIGGWFAPSASPSTKGGYPGIGGTGGGGGSGNDLGAGNGGSGIVILRYEVEQTGQPQTPSSIDYIYNEGVEFFGGLSINSTYPGGYSSLTITKNTNSIDSAYPGSFDRAGFIYTTNKIDVTNYRKVRVLYTMSGGHPSARRYSLELRNSTSETELNVPRWNQFSLAVNRTDYIAEIDISDMKGSYHVAVGCFYSVGQIKKIWLEEDFYTAYTGWSIQTPGYYNISTGGNYQTTPSQPQHETTTLIPIVANTKLRIDNFNMNVYHTINLFNSSQQWIGAYTTAGTPSSWANFANGTFASPSEIPNLDLLGASYFAVFHYNDVGYPTLSQLQIQYETI
jgi:hypothetical protein